MPKLFKSIPISLPSILKLALFILERKFQPKTKDFLPKYSLNKEGTLNMSNCPINSFKDEFKACA